MKFSRVWAMPSPDTFTIAPIREFICHYLAASKLSVDPFARNCLFASYTNDLNPNTTARFHMDAGEFLIKLANDGLKFDLVIFDPPYSPRQISECYKGIGLACGTSETQNAVLYKRVRDALLPVLAPKAVVLSFGWNSSGMGIKRGFEIEEIKLVAHGGAHNDTICLAERRIR